MTIHMDDINLASVNQLVVNNAYTLKTILNTKLTWSAIYASFKAY